jgi:hypothetical protein
MHSHNTQTTATTPPLPLPSPITGSVPNSWAHVSILERLPAVLRQLEKEYSVSDNTEKADTALPAWVRQNRALIEEITTNQRLLPCLQSGPHVEDWNTMLIQLPSEHNQWLSAPWYIVEAYFYRRLLDNTGYFLATPDPRQHILGDPFGTQKKRSLQEALNTIERLVQFVEHNITTASSLSLSSFRSLLYANLWSNRADLSKNPHGLSQSYLDLLQLLQRDQQDILIDHTESVFEYLIHKKEPGSLHVVLDNVGLELVSDLCVATLLTHFKLVDRVVFHAKLHPTFVSDAVPADVDDTLNFLRAHTPTHSVALLWAQHFSERRWHVVGEYYWNHYSPFWEDMPQKLRQQLETATLVIIKGDMNTRRLHGDLRWPFSMETEKIAQYLLRGSPLLLIRTLKSETCSGLTTAQIEHLNGTHKDWLYSGKFGVIQFLSPKG